jgi:ribonuclease-3
MELMDSEILKIRMNFTDPEFLGVHMDQSPGSSRIESPTEFNQRIGIGFENLALLTRALTHRSYINENPDAVEDNERLEFLGDAVLDFLVGAWLYHHYPEMAEGDLTLLRTALVRTEQLAEFARQIDLGSALRLGQGEIVSGGRSRKALLCAGFEALIGGLYLDQGIEAVELFLEPYLIEAVSIILVNGQPRDPKSLLQEWTQARGHNPPVYKTVNETGPDHEKVFEVEVEISNIISGVGKGNSKREASKQAARQVLDKLDINNHHQPYND